MSVRLAVYPSHQITAQDYALQAERSLSSGIFYGGVVTISDSTTLHITSGVGIAHGRIFDITSEDITVELSTGSTLHGRLYVHVDLADADTPISLLTEVAASLSTLTQDEDMNESSGVWEMELATFDVSTTEISNLSYTAPGVSTLGSDNIAAVETGTTATQAYTAGEYVVVGGQLYIVTSAIAIGDTFTVGTNITATTVGTELSELNSRLTVLENGVGYETLFDSGDIQIGYGTRYYSDVKPSDVADYSEVVCIAFQGIAGETSETSAMITATFYPKNLVRATFPTQYVPSNFDVSGSTIYRVAIAFASDISNNYIFARLDSINRNERYLNRFMILGRK